MRPSAPAFTATLASRWRRAAVPWWIPRAVLPVLCGVVFFAMIEMAPSVEDCTPSEPSICGPDYPGVAAGLVMLTTAALLLLRPLAGCVLGVVNGLVQSLVDPSLGVIVPVVFHSAACAFVAIWLVRSRARQRAVYLEAAGGTRITLPRLELEAGSWPRVVAAATAAVVGLGLFGWFGFVLVVEQRHLDRSEQMSATVTAFDDDGYLLDLRVGDSTFSEVEVYDAHKVDENIPVLVDPTDPRWVRLVAEPLDATPWPFFGSAALIAAGIFAQTEIAVRRARRRLSEESLPAVELKVGFDDKGRLGLLIDEARRFQRVLGVVPGPSFRPWFGTALPEDEDEDGDDRPETAPVVGDLCDGGWVAVAFDDSVALPGGPLRQELPFLPAV